MFKDKKKIGMPSLNPSNQILHYNAPMYTASWEGNSK